MIQEKILMERRKQHRVVDAVSGIARAVSNMLPMIPEHKSGEGGFNGAYNKLLKSTRDAGIGREPCCFINAEFGPFGVTRIYFPVNAQPPSPEEIEEIKSVMLKEWSKRHNQKTTEK